MFKHPYRMPDIIIVIDLPALSLPHLLQILSFLIFIVLFVVRYVSGLVAWFYILILPFVACIPALDPLAQVLLKVVQFPLIAGRNIRDGKLGFDEK